jgi:hypothetical protein
VDWKIWSVLVWYETMGRSQDFLPHHETRSGDVNAVCRAGWVSLRAISRHVKCNSRQAFGLGGCTAGRVHVIVPITLGPCFPPTTTHHVWMASQSLPLRGRMTFVTGISRSKSC